MSFAFSDPPDSGVNRSAEAPGAASRNAVSAATRAASRTTRVRRLGKAGGSYLRSPRGLHFVAAAPNRPVAARSRPFECGVALLEECGHTLLEVARARQGVLQLGLEVELAVEVRVEHSVEGPPRGCVRAGGSLRETLDQLVCALEKLVVRKHSIHQPPVERELR